MLRMLLGFCGGKIGIAISKVLAFLEPCLYVRSIARTALMSQSNWVRPPGQTPGISSKKLPGGSGFDF